MATQTPTSANGSVDSSAERVQELNDRILQAGRKATEAYLDATEKTINELADLEVKMANASRVEFVATLATAHADLTRDLARIYVAPVRELVAK